MKDINALTDNKSWFEVPTGPTGERPPNPVAGQMRFDTTRSALEYYNPSVTGWRVVTNSGADYVVATGGTTTTDGDYKVHTFASTANFSVSIGGDVEYLVIAGGGGGASRRTGGGGGAGGYRTSTGTTGGGASTESSLSVTPQTYTVTVGAGGAAGAAGSASSLGTISSVGGGQGGDDVNYSGATGSGFSGGSGGGARSNESAAIGGAGTSGQGYRGGNNGGGTLRARFAGLQVVMDRCVKKEHEQLQN